jgi:hypothetical protein
MIDRLDIPDRTIVALEDDNFLKLVPTVNERQNDMFPSIKREVLKTRRQSDNRKSTWAATAHENRRCRCRPRDGGIVGELD